MTTELCSIQACDKPAVAVLSNRAFCCEHFIFNCHAELAVYVRRFKENRLRDMPQESARRFVDECLREADRIEQSTRDLSDSERAQLLEIILSAAELGRHLRRSHRRVAQIPLLVYSQTPGEPWEEQTETRLVSRYGALVNFHHPVEINERIQVVRRDNSRQAQARVAWWQRRAEGQLDVGIEFVDCDNFWELDWTAP